MDEAERVHRASHLGNLITRMALSIYRTTNSLPTFVAKEILVCAVSTY